MKIKLIAATCAIVCAGSSHAFADAITAWVIDGESERPYFEQLEKAFNAAYGAKGTTLKVVPIPGYNSAIQAAVMSGGLPDIIMLDGPNMANAVWAGTIQPLDDLIDSEIVDDLLPAVKEQGTYGPDGKLYQISPYDSSVLLWGNRKLLQEAGVDIPKTVDQAWNRDEFRDVLDKLSKVKGVQWPLDLKLSYGNDEWLTYGFAPFVQSNGGDIIDREAWKAEGTTNSPANIDALTELQTWFNKGWIVPASGGDNKFYGEKSAALVWVGNWMWAAHKRGLGEDLVLIPAPSFGPKGAKTPNGGWGWSVPATSKNTADIKLFLNFAMSPEQVAAYADTTGYIPSRNASVPLSKLYGKGGEGELFVEEAKCCAVVRPVYPGYPVITTAWKTAVLNIFTGKTDVKQELDTAARAIDQDIEDNSGYPPFGK